MNKLKKFEEESYKCCQEKINALTLKMQGNTFEIAKGIPPINL